MLPAIVCIVIMMVNGNVGAGVAVAGAFSLVRFRSVPGTAKEIGTIFSCNGGRTDRRDGVSWICSIVFTHYGSRDVCVKCDRIRCKKAEVREKTLRITIPEDLNYGAAFDDLFENIYHPVK